MHYGQYLGGTKVMTPKQSGATIGQRQQLSTKDIEGLNEYYCSGPGKKCCNYILACMNIYRPSYELDFTFDVFAFIILLLF